jgi:protein-tyrosine-phosphatase
MKTLFICEHNLGRSQMARAFYNSLVGANTAVSAGTAANMYQEKTMGDFKEETRTVRVMREVGLDLASAPRQQLTPELTRDATQIISFLPRNELPPWLKEGTRVQIWQIENYPAPDLAAVRRLRNEIATRVHDLVRGRME